MIVAVGGNTLSRGLTLEGLGVSFFVRTASAYDTLLQMGRWFGYRSGYADLTRIWMTDEMREWFHHLATVEQEIRYDIERYESEHITPEELGVRIRTHPKLAITAAAKMQNGGAARRSPTRVAASRRSSSTTATRRLAAGQPRRREGDPRHGGGDRGRAFGIAARNRRLQRRGQPRGARLPRRLPVPRERPRPQLEGDPLLHREAARGRGADTLLGHRPGAAEGGSGARGASIWGWGRRPRASTVPGFGT